MSPYQRSDCALTIIVGAIFFAMAVWVIAVAETASQAIMIFWGVSAFLLGGVSLGILPMLSPFLIPYLFIKGHWGECFLMVIFGAYPLLSVIAMVAFDVPIME